METSKIIYCADVIAIASSSPSRYVIIERLGEKSGFALPGGKQEPNEILSETARRELLEETGLWFESTHVLGTYAEPDRDPRGQYISTVFIGTAEGVRRGEKGKTRAHLLDREEILKREKDFVFDHFAMLADYFKKHCRYY